MELYSNRRFLQDSPSLNSISWQVESRYNEKFILPNYFYGKFTVNWGSAVVGIHSYGEHGEVGQSKFAEKCKSVITCIDTFLEHVESQSFTTYHLLLNDDDTPFSGSIYYKLGVTPSGSPICVFEIASCKQKIRLHAHELGGEAELVSVLNLIKISIEECLALQPCWRKLNVKKV